IDRYTHALGLKPDYDLVVINMANAYRALGRDEEAMIGYRRFMELDPKNAQIRYETAQILIDNGKLDDARAELTHALALEPKLAAARNALGVLALRRGDVGGAEREIRAAIAEKADVRLAHYNLALLAEPQGDRDEPELCGRTFVPCEGVSRLGTEPRRSGAARAPGDRAGARLRLRAARPLRDRGRIFAPRTPRRSRAGSRARPGARKSAA